MFEKCLERFYVLSCSRLLDCGIEIIYVRKTLHGGQNLMKKSKESPGKIIKQTLVFTGVYNFKLLNVDKVGHLGQKINSFVSKSSL